MTERQLIDACAANDRLAQRMLYERYKNAMYTTAYRITGDFEQANEALQDAFLQVFRHIRDFEGRSTIGAWIKKIVIRAALSMNRKRQMSFEEIEPWHEAEVVDWGNSLDAEYLEKAIQRLPEGYRAVFLLSEVEGYTHKEIGEMLQISEGTSKSQLFYAKKKLREWLITAYAN
jgi:RNA polymerase sigma factor (sigma-70 family)